MQHSSITLEVYYRKVWKLLLRQLRHSDDIRVKSYVRIILGHPIEEENCLLELGVSRTSTCEQWIVYYGQRPLVN